MTPFSAILSPKQEESLKALFRGASGKELLESRLRQETRMYDPALTDQQRLIAGDIASLVDVELASRPGLLKAVNRQLERLAA